MHIIYPVPTLFKTDFKQLITIKTMVTIIINHT